MFYQMIKIEKDEIGLVWRDFAGRPLIKRIYLPDNRKKFADRIARDFSSAALARQKAPCDIVQIIIDLYEGKKRNFDLALLDFSPLSEFSRHVLLQTSRIPRSRVITYAVLAVWAGYPRAARAVGTALANNPFPIVIPCHRVTRSGGFLGQFGGGSAMKRQLLEKEGVLFAAPDKISTKSIVPSVRQCAFSS